MKLSEMARAALRERLIKARAVRMANVAARKLQGAADKVEAGKEQAVNLLEEIGKLAEEENAQFVVAYTLVRKSGGAYSLRRYYVPVEYAKFTEEPEDIWGVQMGKLIMALEGLR